MLNDTNYQVGDTDNNLLRKILQTLQGSGDNGLVLQELQAIHSSLLFPGPNGSIPQSFGARTLVSVSNPTISTLAYSSGMVVGGTQVVPLLIPTGLGILDSLSLIDRSAQKAPNDLLIFSSRPTTATTGDRQTFAFGEDANKLLLVLSSVSSDWISVAGQAVVTHLAMGAAIQSNDGNLYIVMVNYGTPTYSGTHDLQFTWGAMQG
jgi:hypothetical protein